jgi:protein-disulfide isomerase
MGRNRLLLLAGAVVVAVVVVAGAIALGSRGDSNGAGTTTAAEPSSAAEQMSFLEGIPRRGATLGEAGAPVTLDVYEDPQCPYCRDWALGALPATVRDYVADGRVKLVYRGINIIGPNSELGLRAIYAAGLQNKLWEMADALYRMQGDENSGWITRESVRHAAEAAGADGDAIIAHAGDAAVTKALVAAAKQAMADRVQGTPTFVVRRALAQPRQLQPSGLDAAAFESALESALG